MANTKELRPLSDNKKYRKKTVDKEHCLKKREIIARSIGVFFARAVIFYGVSPFGISYLATERRFGVKSLISFAFVCLGYASLFELDISLMYIFAATVYMAFLFIAGNDEEDIPTVVCVSAVGVATALGRVCGLIWCGAASADAVKLLCDVALAMSGAYVFEKNRLLLSGRKSRIFSMDRDEKLCLALSCVILLFGLKNISVNEFISLGKIAALWLTVMTALCCGVGGGTACGMAVGTVLGFGNDITLYVTVFSICGFICGITGKYNRNLAIFFMCGTAVSSMILSGMGGELFGYLDIPLALLSVILTPEAFIGIIGRVYGVRPQSSDADRWRDYAKTKLNAAASSFRTLANTFLDLSDDGDDTDMTEVSVMFDRTADRVCRECPKMSECWVNNFNNTYNSLLGMLEVMEEKGEASISDADEYFARKCLRLRSVTREMNRLFEIYKLNRVWKCKIRENRALAGEQLGSVAQILEGISEDLCEKRIDAATEEEVCSRIEAKGVNVLSFSAVSSGSGRYSAYLEVSEGCDKDNCRRVTETALKSVLGSRMMLSGVVKTNGGVMMKFSQPEGYIVEAGSSSVSSDDVNGDKCILRYLSDGKFAAAISDGMGTGSEAARDSGATVELLGEFLEAGFDKEIAVRLVNSIMVMKSVDEAFATVDMCVIDLFGGEAEFIKNCAEPSFIKHGDTVETIRSASLPVGVIKGVEAESFLYKAEDKDVIVMVSDGVLGKSGKESRICDEIRRSGDDMPAQELADRIIDSAIGTRGKPSDDMTVVVLKIRRR